MVSIGSPAPSPPRLTETSFRLRVLMILPIYNNRTVEKVGLGMLPCRWISVTREQARFEYLECLQGF